MRTEHQASRAEHQPSPPGSGMAGLEREVMAVPPDKDALGLVEALQDNVGFKHEDTPYQLQSRLLIAQDNLARLAALLEERDAAREAGQEALSDIIYGFDNVGSKYYGMWRGSLAEKTHREALARVKGAS